MTGRQDKQGLPIVEFADRAGWARWLRANHESAGVWLKFAKKNSGKRTVNYAEALEEALCYGWIDGQAGAYDEHFYLQRFTRRRPRSKWSRLNRERAQALIAQGRMRAPGLLQVRAAQEDGRWDDAYEPQSTATVPPDFQRELEGNARAAEFFDALTGSARYAFLYRLHQVKQPQRRAERIARYIDLLSAGKTLQD